MSSLEQALAEMQASAGQQEERVRELQEKKRDLAAAVLGGAAATLADLGTEDLEFLLS